MLDEIRDHDAILLGAVGGKPGDPRLPAGILERGLLLRLRFELDHYVNLRPSRTYPGVPSPLADPGEVDFVVVREGTEGPYTGNGGRLRGGTPAEVATEVSLNTAYGVERVVRDAFARASRRPRRQLTLVHKTNVLVHAGGALVARGRRGRRGVPRRDRRLPARRRGHDLPDHRPGPLRRDRHRQPVRRHPHRPRRRRHRRHRPRRLGQHQPRAHHARRCSSRCTARPPTSPASGRPTRPPRSSRRRCCSTTSATPTRRRAIDEAVYADLTARVPGATRRTVEIGDAIAARVA